MAEIRVERRRGIPWWAWLLCAVALALVIWLLVSLKGERPIAGASLLGETTNVPTSEPDPRLIANPAATTATASPADTSTLFTQTVILDPLDILRTSDKPSLIGRRVQIEAVPVQRVVGDRTFWAGPDQEHQLLVVLDEQATPADPTEGRYDVNAGQMLTIAGEIRAFPGVEAAVQRWG